MSRFVPRVFLVGLIAAVCLPSPARCQAPSLTSIVDVGNDQGRHIWLHFDKSSRDTIGSPTPILQYEAFRRVDPLPGLTGTTGIEVAETRTRSIRSARDRGMLSDARLLMEGWVFAGAVPAHGLDEYSMIAPTLADSTVADGMHWSVFFIRAATAEPWTYFDSPPDSGYSLDNLAPAVPSGFSVAYNGECGNVLSWDANPDGDLDFFNVYRRNTEVQGSEWIVVQRVAQNGWTDHVPEGWRYGYRLTAVDFSGNESGPAEPDEVTGVDVPGAAGLLLLHQNSPNPFNPVTSIRFDLRVSARVTLAVYNVRGERVRTLVNEWMSAGRKTVEWDGRLEGGRSAASGVYFYRLSTVGISQIRKAVLVR